MGPDQMAKAWRIANLVVLGLLVAISFLGTFYKHITFGLGLGDIFGYAMLYLTTLIHAILTFFLRKKGSIVHAVLTLVFLPLTIWICLEATLWRNSSYAWNGSIFYLPCPTEIEISNGSTKTLLITMCSMQYYSAFNATWDGVFMQIGVSKPRIPDELQKYIHHPITVISIEPELENRSIDEQEQRPKFSIDTLVVNKTYSLEGEIVGINKSIPVFRVRIVD